MLPDPAANVLETLWNEEWQRNIVDVAMERVRRRANPEHYQILHLHVVKGLAVRDVAKLTGASLQPDLRGFEWRYLWHQTGAKNC